MAKSRRADKPGNGVACRVLPELVARDPGNRLIFDLASQYCRARAVKEMASALHDLRSSFCSTRLNLAALRGLVERLTDPSLTREQIVETTHSMSTCLRAMEVAGQLDEDILDRVTPLPKGAQLEPRMAKLGDVIESTRAVMCSQCSPRGLVVVRDTPDVLVAASAGDLIRVLINLLRNAVTAIAGSPSPRVEISAWVTGTAAFVRVEDNGCGMETDPMSSVPRELVVSQPAGSGLGLLSVRLCIERWHGQMEIRSTRGKGTEIVFSIPLATPGRPAIGEVD
jgi:signal transduction histidine kinase